MTSPISVQGNSIFSIAQVKSNIIFLIFLHSTYAIHQQVLFAPPSKYSQNLTTYHYVQCPFYKLTGGEVLGVAAHGFLPEDIHSVVGR